MNFNKSSTFLSCIIFILFPSLITSQTCQKSCGNIPIKYPFGTGPGCGDPRFQPYVICNNQQLSFKTHIGCYPVTSIDYNYQIMYISDPSMSTCACTQPSKGFSLDANAPFTFHDDTVFALLDCETDSSPIYKSNNGGINSTFPMCDSQGAPICNLLYSCQAISRLNLPISTCCVYTPVDLGPEFEMDLEKLHCSSYSALYGFSGEELNPQAWKYGIALKYKFNFNNDYPDMCANCEKSNGVCGYGGSYSSFVCNCPSGFNTTNDCYLGSSWSNSFKNVPWHIRGVLLIYAFGWFIVLVLQWN